MMIRLAEYVVGDALRVFHKVVKKTLLGETSILDAHQNFPRNAITQEQAVILVTADVLAFTASIQIR